MLLAPRSAPSPPGKAAKPEGHRGVPSERGLTLEDGNRLKRLNGEINVVLGYLRVRAGCRKDDQPELIVAIVENPQCDGPPVRWITKLETPILAELEGMDS